MIDQLMDTFRQQFENQVFSGGLLLLILGTLAAAGRKIPGMIWSALLRRFVVSVEILDIDPLFDWTQQWLSRHAHVQRSRLLSALSRLATVDVRRTGGPKYEIELTPVPGIHLVRDGMRWLLIRRIRIDAPSAEHGGGRGISSKPFYETILIETLGASRATIRNLLSEIRDAALPPTKPEVAIKVNHYDHWRTLHNRAPRNLDSIVLPTGLLEDIVQDIRGFLNEKDRYAAWGIPYQRGFLLEGAPGSGKSSLVMALASHFGRDLYVVGVNQADEVNFREAMTKVGEHAFVLIEDVDSIFTERTGASKDQQISFSCLLNTLDGALAPEGRVIFLTSNHAERLDPALIREGRIDRRIRFENASREQVRSLFLRFFPGSEELAEAYVASVRDSAQSMAYYQREFLACKHDPRRLLDARGNRFGGHLVVHDSVVAGR